MIFNKELDDSLRLILESDKKRCYRISNFIRSIPNELFEQIYVKLKEYEEHKQNGINVFDMNDFCLRGECFNQLNRKYSFIIDMLDNSITISRYLPTSEKMFETVNDDFVKMMEITLYERSSFNDVSELKSQILGKFFDCSRNFDRTYSLNSTFLGNMVTYVDNIGLRRYQRVDINSDAGELSLENIYEIRRKVRVRKLK